MDFLCLLRTVGSSWYHDTKPTLIFFVLGSACGELNPLAYFVTNSILSFNFVLVFPSGTIFPTEMITTRELS
jgi:hypothetical protein